MTQQWLPGTVLSRGDLYISLTNSSGVAENAYSVTFALYYEDPIAGNVLIGSATRTPVNPSTGEYYAAIQIPPTAVAGNYNIRWTFQEYASSTPQTVVQEWQVVSTSSALAVTYTAQSAQMIQSLRTMIRDLRPDSTYRFRPPEYSGSVGNFNQVFGQIWKDDELYEYLSRAVDWFNMFPPETADLKTVDDVVNRKPVWRTAILYSAISMAMFALQSNWSADEFDYNIGGISLNLERSSKYQSLAENAEQMFDKATEAKARTVKFMRGLSQPKYGVGIRSSFGPYVGNSILSPRNFL